MPRLELVGFVSPWPNPIVPWLTRLPSARTPRTAEMTTISAAGRRLTRAATCAQRRLGLRGGRLLGRPEGARAEQREQRRQQGEGRGEHHRDPDREDRAEPVGRLEVGEQQDEHRRDHGRRPRRRAPARSWPAARASAASGGPPRAELLAVAVDEQQRVVGPRAEDQDEEQHRPLGVDGDPAGLDQQVGDPARDQVGGADGEQRQQGEQRGAVDGEQEEEDEAEGRDQQRLAGLVGDLLEVGGDPAGPGHVGGEAGPPVLAEVVRGSRRRPR